jgi:hypothetical protein
MHVYHDELGCPDGTILFDGCPECEERAQGIQGACELDATNFRVLWGRMISTEFGEGDDRYRTHAEARLGSRLYNMAVLMERHLGIDPYVVMPAAVPS